MGLKFNRPSQYSKSCTIQPPCNLKYVFMLKIFIRANLYIQYFVLNVFIFFSSEWLHTRRTPQGWHHRWIEMPPHICNRPHAGASSKGKGLESAFLIDKQLIVDVNKDRNQFQSDINSKTVGFFFVKGILIELSVLCELHSPCCTPCMCLSIVGIKPCKCHLFHSYECET